MESENNNLEQLSMFENEENESTEHDNTLEEDKDFKEAVYSKMREIHNQGLIVGFQTACHTALDKIYTFENSAGKKSANDYKRCLKDLKKFFEIGISRKANSNETAKQEENTDTETAQN
jgi:hypothetical protein